MLELCLRTMRPLQTLLQTPVSTEAAYVAEPKINNLDALVPRTSGLVRHRHTDVLAESCAHPEADSRASGPHIKAIHVCMQPELQPGPGRDEPRSSREFARPFEGAESEAQLRPGNSLR